MLKKKVYFSILFLTQLSRDHLWQRYFQILGAKRKDIIHKLSKTAVRKEMMTDGGTLRMLSPPFDP